MRSDSDTSARELVSFLWEDGPGEDNDVTAAREGVAEVCFKSIRCLLDLSCLLHPAALAVCS